MSAERLTGHALFGGFIGTETPFAGIDKLPAGTIATLLGGRIEFTQRWRMPTATTTVPTAFREAMAAMLSAAPNVELELSGGLDSRIILAAIPPEARKDRRAITIGLAGEPSEDVTVARDLAQSSELDWRLLDASEVSELDASGLETMLLSAAAAYDHMANPLDKITLILAGRNRRVDARLGGQNGEILRGFYYPAQPLSSPPSENLARGLISMRLQANDRVEDVVLSSALRRELRADAEARMTKTLLSFEGTWGQALDQFYLYQRMQNWVGNATGHRLMDHAPLYPFFDPAFVAAALSLAPEEKLNSRAAYQLLCDLDMDLAQRPLAGGIVPARARHGGRGSDLVLDGQRILGRLGRLLKGRGRATLGSRTITDHWRRLNLHARLPVDALARTGLFDLDGLARIGSGEFAPSRPTLGFVLLIASLEKRS
ncbi:MAG: hypothetical protein ABS78_09720 [Phenylobacterium sp. SCN 70-31]|nr:MAG: hypothetical protein ABS78_09720 [Phenylobacterium sp. SCN 70-31]